SDVRIYGSGAKRALRFFPFRFPQSGIRYRRESSRAHPARAFAVRPASGARAFSRGRLVLRSDHGDIHSVAANDAAIGERQRALQTDDVAHANPLRDAIRRTLARALRAAP